jgi:hypothetical protein
MTSGSTAWYRRALNGLRLAGIIVAGCLRMSVALSGRARQHEDADRARIETRRLEVELRRQLIEVRSRK